MESGAIPDEAITASSSYVPNVGPKNGRLRIERAGGGWCPKQQVEKGVREYLQIDLGDVNVITGIETQGRYDRGRGQEYTEEYTLEYWRPGLGKWKEYRRWDGKQVLRGNSDTATVESHKLMPPIFASKLRILPYSVHRRTVCLRVELLGCLYDGGVISYSAPTGSDPDLGLVDSSYDGETSDGQLYNGLGRLVDGEIGADNFRLDIGYGKGNGWVAWKNSSSLLGYIELVFQFDEVRNFSSVHLFTNNYFTKGVQVFSMAKIMFSVGGQFYNGPTLSYSYMPDRVMESSRNVTINLHYRIGRFVKMRLYFASSWIMLSEIVFDSVPIAWNITEEEEPQNAEHEVVINSVGQSNFDAFETITARKKEGSYTEVVVGVLTAIMLLLLVVFVVILLVSRRHKLQGSPTLLRNPFGVTLNMKGLLMNFSSANNTEGSDHPTPLSQGPPSHHNSIHSANCTDQYQTPLVNSYFSDKIEVMKDFTTMPEPVLSLETPPPMDMTEGYWQEGPVYIEESPPHYHSLQGTPNASPKSNLIDLGSFFPKVDGSKTTKKRYHTAPREKQRILPPVVCWNIAPSMGHKYCCKEEELIPIPRYCLKPLEKIGSCHAGEIRLCETERLEDIIAGVGRLVVVRTPSPVETNRVKNNVVTASIESLRELRFLAGLTDPSLCRVLGVCTAEQPPWTIIEYGDMGDLAEYLQFIIKKSGSTRCSSTNPLSIGCLIFMATQIAWGMRYLESKHVVHKDLAARNCLVGRGYVVKIADVAMCKPQYKKDYAEIGGRPPAPIRWLPWESILLDRYLCSSSVWAFAVTLWEILHYACEKPFHHLTNELVIQNAEHMYYGGELQVLLNKPTICPSELYELMCQCWRRENTSRPTFKQIHLFLKHMNKDFVPSDLIVS
ncbi:discoidin domain-containing receptor 2-like [Agrilus planipennis]|uniref:Discoidin domain-containing receptor 2-like n=1 Tax=Agrilus planipennis TaxID=224129 RepID=A0A7F5RI46_AGRPL|nr:discoidin domain-containing receptor 2-like [Agrilus planipennis]